jgi:HSP20 family molecular chaperone IbpA
MSRFMKIAAPLLVVLLWAVAVSARDRAAASRESDPWNQMLAFQKQMDEMFEEQNRLFFPSPALPRGALVPSPEADVRVERGPEATTVVFKVPGLERKSLKVDVNRGGISLSCDRRDVREDRDSRGRVTARSESYESVRQSVPVPRGVDPDSARIEPKDDEVRVIFRAKPAASLKS